ncbi:hypothetical protein [Antarcticirhabdus aurantiaca]|uniref:Uncharacterized protein n=1 Tax=Antarcticirhabdus aurantiaca TaxID=2606717 RepID=A0ACD4NLB0_9HYPH|nr:hypothetical protein [Antarcticirhabdus aurantiaca]WAJ27406.1 hypothetical protein OXU80_21550 [Jeongeuplla avenae]
MKHDEIVSEGDAGSAEIEAELREEQPSQDHIGDKADDGADLVNVGKFNDETILDDGRDPTEPDGGEKRTKDADRSVADVFGIDPKHLHRPG